MILLSLSRMISSSSLIQKVPSCGEREFDSSFNLNISGFSRATLSIRMVTVTFAGDEGEIVTTMVLR